MKRLLLLIALAFFTGIPHVQAGDREGRTLRVPAPFATIQGAVDAAQAGDLIVVAPGTYCENVVISKSDVRVWGPDAGKGRRPSLGGTSCTVSGTGITITGTAALPVANVEIRGVVVDGFETGILLQNVVRSRIIGNEVMNNKRDGVPRSVAAGHSGIILKASSFNEVSHNFVHNNGHMGIGLSSGSNANIVRANRLIDNQSTYTSSCSLMVFVNSLGNQIIDNEVADTTGAGIMLGNGSSSGPQASATLVTGNRVTGHPLAGIVVEPMSPFNLILRNDATGNGLDGSGADLVDHDASGTNLWLGNAGGCSPGNAGCLL